MDNNDWDDDFWVAYQQGYGHKEAWPKALVSHNPHHRFSSAYYAWAEGFIDADEMFSLKQK